MLLSPFRGPLTLGTRTCFSSNETLSRAPVSRTTNSRTRLSLSLEEEEEEGGGGRGGGGGGAFVMGKKANKSGSAAAAAAKKERQAAKQNKAAKKAAKKDAREAGEDDIEKILAEIMAKEAAKTAVTVTSCERPPTPRANFSLTTLPTGDLLLFGGEYYDGQEAVCYNELYRWSLDKDAWKMIESPNTPPPRCSHQAVAHGGFLYIFGGEFATSEQFYHYNDLWRLCIKSNQWEKLEPAGKGPSARSGHRMAVWRNRLIVCGGFYEAFRETKWYQDLYILHLTEMKWEKISFPTTALLPGPRSGHQVAVHEPKDVMYMYGGYSKIKEPGQGKEAKVYEDLWCLSLKPILSGHAPKWDKLGKKGAPPSKRSGAAMVVHKGRALLFGGVIDEEVSNNTLNSTFYNDLFAFDMDRRQWFQLGLKKEKEKGGRRRKQARPDDGDEEEEGRGQEENEEDYLDSDDELAVAQRQDKAFVYVGEDGKLIYVAHEEDETKEEEEIKGGGEKESKPPAAPIHEEEETKDGGKEADTDNDAKASSDASSASWPLPRINPGLTVRGNTIYVYGGLLEIKDREYTLDDCWALDLNTRTCWRQLLPGTMHEQIWKDEEEDDDDDDEDGEEDDDDESGSEGDSDSGAEGNSDIGSGEEKDRKNKSRPRHKEPKKRVETLRDEIRRLKDQLGLDDPMRTPQLEETLRDFFARTTVFWTSEQLKILENQGEDRGGERFSEKEVRRDAFALAQARFGELEPLLNRLNELEEEQREAEARSREKKKAESGKRRGSANR
jgi:N-acetylneuraminic acid mutarotase